MDGSPVHLVECGLRRTTAPGIGLLLSRRLGLWTGHHCREYGAGNPSLGRRNVCCGSRPRSWRQGDARPVRFCVTRVCPTERRGRYPGRPLFASISIGGQLGGWSMIVVVAESSSMRGTKGSLVHHLICSFLRSSSHLPSPTLTAPSTGLGRKNGDYFQNLLHAGNRYFVLILLCPSVN